MRVNVKINLKIYFVQKGMWKIMYVQKSSLFHSSACGYCNTNLCKHFVDVIEDTKSKLDDLPTESTQKLQQNRG